MEGAEGGVPFHRCYIPARPKFIPPCYGRLDEKRNRLRFVLKQRFEEWAVRPMARLLGSDCTLQS